MKPWYLFYVVEENYGVRANASLYQVTTITASKTGTVTLPFTIFLNRGTFSNNFFTSPSNPAATNSIQFSPIFIGSSSGTLVQFTSGGTIEPVSLSASGGLPIFTDIVDVDFGPTLIIQDEVTLNYEIIPPNVLPTHQFMVGINIVSGPILYSRTEVFRVSVRVLPARKYKL